MADQIVQIPADSTGKKIDVTELTVGSNTVERQRIVIAGAAATDLVATATATPAGTEVGLITRPIPSGTQAVSGTFWQATQPVSGPVALSAGSAVIGHVIVDTAPTTAVTGTFWQATQPVSGTVSVNALPTGSNVIGHVIVDTTSTTAVTQATGSNLHAVIDTGSTTAVTQATGSNLHAVLDANSGVDIGKLTANQSVNVAQVNGVTTLTGNGVTGTGSQRVTLASDNTAFAVIPTPPAAGATGWQFKFFGDGTVGTDWNGTKQQIVGTATTFGGYVDIFNPNTATSYVQIFNLASASVTLGTTVPNMVIPLPGIAAASATGAGRNLEIGNGVKFSTGLTMAVTTTVGGSTAPASKCYGTILYN